MTDKGSLSKICKQLIQPNLKNTNNPIKKWAETWRDIFPKKTYSWPSRHGKRCSASLIIREMQIKTTMRYHWTPVSIVVVWLFSCVQLFVTPWTVAHPAPLSRGFPRQEYWSGLSFSSSGDPLWSRIKPASPALAGRFFTTKPPGKPHLSGWQSSKRPQITVGEDVEKRDPCTLLVGI